MFPQLAVLVFIVLCVRGQQNPNIRLVGPTASEGRVEVNINGVWGTVCDDQFDSNDAEVVCRMLGSKSPVHLAAVEAAFGSGTGKIHYDELNCAGSETDLSACPVGTTFHDCFHSEDAGVICDSADIKFRLAGSNDTSSGRVEVRINGRWGTVCDDLFDSGSAKVVCKQLGLPSAQAYPFSFGPGTGDIWLDDVICMGSEGNLLECNQTEIGNNDCEHSEDVGVFCTDTPPKLQARLVNGSRPDEGRLEVNIGGGWGTVCDDSFDNDAATVVCNMLGYSGGRARSFANAYFGQGKGGILMDDVTCTGTETSLGECPFSGFGVSDCDHDEDVGVICHSETSQLYNIKVRLANGQSPSEGRVEILLNGRWGTVCDDDFDDREAKVICDMLNFTNGTAIGVSEAYFGQGSGPIYMDDLQCTGREDSIAVCQFAGFGTNDCDHDEDAGVICDAQQQNLTVRLVDGKAANEGRLEVLHAGIWGTVCDDYWSNSNNAKVVCRMLGYPTGNAEAVTGAYFGQGSGQVWLDNVRCRGSENSLDACRHAPFGVNNCDHDEDVGVRCASTSESPIRLHGGTTPYEGRVEVFHDGHWGTVCNDGFNQNAAKVVCNSIGYPSSNPMIINQTFGAPPSRYIWFDGLRCMGNETSLDLCRHNNFGNNDCDHSEDVAVRCRAHGIKCYHCDGLEDPAKCQETLQCAAGEVCEEANYIAGGVSRYSLTCQSKLVCDAIKSGNFVGRRKRQGQTLDVKCCETPLCNRDLISKKPGTGGGTTGTCQDDPKVDCNVLDLTNICANPQAAKVYCRKHCGLCP